MLEKTRTFTVSARDVRPLAARASPADVRRILGELGLPADVLAEGSDRTIDLADFFRVLERLSLEVQDETCRLSSRPLIPGSTHFVWSGAAGAPNLQEAMKRVAQAYNMLHGGHYNYVEWRDSSLAYIIDDRGFPYTAREQQDYIYFFMECVLVFLRGTLMLLSGDGLDAHLRRVWSPRPKCAPQSGQLDFLAVPIRWNAPAYALVYDLPAAAMPVRASPADLPAPNAVYRKIIGLIEAEEAGGRHRQTASDRVAELLDHGTQDQTAAARALGMSVATLRRRLMAEGSSFRGLKSAALDRAAKERLRQGQHVAEVADALGFSDFRSFSRAFKAWNGMTPAAWRAEIGS